MRPRTLAEVAEWVLRCESFDLSLRSFLDEFRRSPANLSLEAEPVRLRDRVPRGDLFDAYLAATADYLSLERGLPEPEWARAEDRKLRRPWFALPWAGMRAILLVESPAAFRSRNLFVSANALSRA